MYYIVNTRDVVGMRIRPTVNLIRNTLIECNLLGVTTKLSGQRIRKARRLNGG